MLSDTPEQIVIAPHKPVLVSQVLEYLVPAGEHGKRVFLDVTFGSGGHTRAILERDPNASVIAFDWDTQAFELFGYPMQDEFGDRLRFVWGNFANLYSLLKKEKIAMVDGILADFGTSQVQLSHRAGFSFYIDTPLDMRMSPAHGTVTAREVIATFSESKLADLFWQLGEEKHSRAIARAIVQERAKNSIRTTKQLALVVEKAIGWHKKSFHPATRVFQALRIFINKELDNISAFLAASVRMVKPGGRVVCISFHSLEDRLVKQFFREQEQKGVVEVLTHKVVVADEREVDENPASRSAKLRAVQIVNQEGE